MVTDYILAAFALGFTVVGPRSWSAALGTAGAAGAAVAVGSGAFGAALAATSPTIAFLVGAVGLAALAVRLGAAELLATGLVRASAGHPGALYGLVCLTTAIATALLSLDGAVVLLVPVVLALGRRGASLRPLLLGVVAVANAFSLGVPEGNPTNLVVLARLGGGLGAYTARALPAGVVAAVICAAGVAWLERGAQPVHRPSDDVRFVAGMGEIARLGVHLSALLVVLIPIARRLPAPAVHGIGGWLAVSAGTAAVAGLVNNLPASAAIAAGLTGPTAFAALVGVSVGALATEHGSVATSLAGELAGVRAYERRLVPVVAAALALATIVLYASSAT